jgi:PAS domain S-box-containing protein
VTTRTITGGVRFAAFLEMIPEAVVAVDASGAVAVANVRAVDLFGFAPGELVDQPLEVLIPGAFRELLSRHDVVVDATESAQPQMSVVLITARRKDGSEFQAEVLLTSALMGGRSVTVAAIRDVTERKRMNGTFSRLVEVADEAAITVDRVGMIASVNREAEALFGYASNELVDQSVEVLVPAPKARVRGQRRNPRNTVDADAGLGVVTPLEGRRKDGSEFPVEISLSAVETKEGPLVSAAIRDAGDRAASRREEERAEVQRGRDLLESRLHQSHRLESLGQLAGGVAHDFNNLLAAILNYVGFVSDEIRVEIATRPTDARERLNAVLSDVAQIGAAAERAAALTHQLLSFARREVRVLEVLDVNGIVSEVESLLRRTLGEHVTLVTHGAADLKAVRADRGQIEQILLNLAVNARDAMPDGGTLSVDTENFTVDEDYAALHPVVEAGSYVCLRVSDTGAGMDQETLDRAFEPFFSTKPKDKGTGLGLATVYGIVSQTGGLVELQSEVGSGTTVMMLLPSDALAVTAHDPQPRASRQRAGETVLVVEDEELVLDVTSRILTQHGYRVLAARSGAEAMMVIDAHEGAIDLLLTDVVMPGATGKEVAEWVSAVRPDIHVLYMSGYPEPVIASQAVIEQGIRMLSKPFKASDLLEHVRAVLDA